ncbi:MAG: type II secretion system minor pseudopilin GspJ [Gammaproteobacteria bacterium]|nr:type II secretion system minor pseudopilin GspJ [Gammaproteobacteria bacterium]
MIALKRQARGFSLIELLISLAVFSILSVMAYSGLQIVLDSKGHTEQQADRLVEVQRAMTIIQRDIEQVIGRSIRDSYGDRKPALEGSFFGEFPLSFTRAGKRNPMKRVRSTMERVSYRLAEEKLDRLSVEMLDQPHVVEPLERHLLSDVKELKFRYMDKDLQWQDAWPPQFGEQANPSALPRGVEMTIKVEGIGEIKRLFRVTPGEYAGNKRQKQSTQTNGGNNAQGNQNTGDNQNTDQTPDNSGDTNNTDTSGTNSGGTDTGGTDSNGTEDAGGTDNTP